MRSRRENTTRRCHSPFGWRGYSSCRSRRFSMMVSKGRPMTHDPSAKGLAGALGWPIAIVMGTAMLLGGFAGYNQAVADNGGQPAPAWLALVVAPGSCGIAFAAYLRAYRPTWRQWAPPNGKESCRDIGGQYGESSGGAESIK